MHDPVLNLLGLARKAGKLEIGEEPVGAVCRSRHARLIMLAQDAAPNTFRRAAHFGEAGNVLWLVLPYSKFELGFHLGRSSCAILAFTDAGFAASLVEKLAVRDPFRYGPAAEQLRTKANRMLQRQREKRQHEKNLREGKRKPWVSPPPAPMEEPVSPPRSAGRKTKPSAPRTPAQPPRDDFRPGGFDKKPGPGGRRLSGKFRHNP